MKVGYVAIVGEPNVGKSTLLNYLIKQKISIVSRRPQTTRHRILGIKTTPHAQIIYIDTPGIHQPGKRALSRYLNRAALSAFDGVDAIVWVIDDLVWDDNDQLILSKLQAVTVPVLLAINKIDRLHDKACLLPFMQQAMQSFAFKDLIPLSALYGDNLANLENCLIDLLPQGEAIYPPDWVSDKPEHFFVAEIIREKLTRCLSSELPYALTVEIERFEEGADLNRIYAVIWVEREGQKAIVIGKGGAVLKRVGARARADIEQLTDKKAFLQLWVKVRKDWSDNDRALLNLGYGDVGTG